MNHRLSLFCLCFFYLPSCKTKLSVEHPYSKISSDILCDNDSNYTQVSDRIPKIIHQIWHNWGKQSPPEEYQKWADTIKKMHPDWEYKLWDDTRSLAFMKEYYPQYVSLYESYQKGKKKRVKKVDVLRYFILDYYGGIYLDFDTQVLKPLDELVKDCQFVAADEGTEDGRGGWINMAFIGSIKNHKLLTYIQENLKITAAIADVTKSTGPKMFTKRIHEFMHLYPTELIKIYPREYAYPYGWWEKLTAINAIKCRKNSDVCQSLFPKAYMISHWGNSWAD